MAKEQSTKYKTKEMMAVSLEAALDMEKEKYAKCRVKSDMSPDYVNAQAWGYVVAGYFLMEKSFNAILRIRGKKVPKEHSLEKLFRLLKKDDQEILRECYTDYKATSGGHIASFPVDSLDDFLSGLDGGGKNKRETHTGSLDWRYLLIEEKKSDKMPLVSVDYMHEIVHTCVKIIEGSSVVSRSSRMRNERHNNYHEWVRHKMNSGNWSELGDRIEILWGPDDRGCCDLLLFKDDDISLRVSRISDIQTSPPLPVIDRKKEIKDFFRGRGTNQPSKK